MTTTAVRRAFAANTECPRCEVIAVHWMRKPRPIPQRDDYPSIEGYVAALIMGRAGACLGRVLAIDATTGQLSPMRLCPADEYEAAVVRICRDCTNEWCEY